MRLLAALPFAPFARVKPGGVTSAKVQRKVLRYVLGRRRNIMAQTSATYREAFELQGKRVVGRFLAGEGIRAFVSGQAVALQVRAAMDGEDDRVKAQVGALYDTTLGREYEAMSALFGADAAALFQAGSWRREAMRKQLLDMVKGINETTRLKVEAVVQEGVQLGLGPTDIARGRTDLGYPGIEGTFEDFGRGRAQLIARTESMRMQEAGNGAAMTDLGVKTCDVIGCEDNEIMPGETYGCNSKGVPIAAIGSINFHPNHRGASVPATW